MGRKQRIGYVPVEKMDEDMRAEMDRCRREGTPRPESSAVRAHVPECFWSFANSWQAIFRNGVCDHAIKELCRVYVSRSVKCEYCGNQRSEQAARQALAEAHRTPRGAARHLGLDGARLRDRRRPRPVEVDAGLLGPSLIRPATYTHRRNRQIDQKSISAHPDGSAKGGVGS